VSGSSRPPVGQRAFTLQRLDPGVEQFVVHGDLAHLGFQPAISSSRSSRSFRAVAAPASARYSQSANLKPQALRPDPICPLFAEKTAVADFIRRHKLTEFDKSRLRQMRIHVGALRFDLLAVRCPDTQAKAVRLLRIASIGVKGARDQFSSDYGFQPCHAVPGLKAESDPFVRCGFNLVILGISLPTCALKRNGLSTQYETGAPFLSASIECACERCERGEENNERNLNFHLW
jgi:hypothetical protein